MSISVEYFAQKRDNSFLFFPSYLSFMEKQIRILFALLANKGFLWIYIYSLILILILILIHTTSHYILFICLAIL